MSTQGDIYHTGGFHGRKYWEAERITKQGRIRMRRLQWSRDIIAEPGCMFRDEETVLAVPIANRGGIIHNRKLGTFTKCDDKITVLLFTPTPQKSKP